MDKEVIRVREDRANDKRGDDAVKQIKRKGKVGEEGPRWHPMKRPTNSKEAGGGGGGSSFSRFVSSVAINEVAGCNCPTGLLNLQA